MSNGKIRLIANIKRDEKRFKAILFNLSVKLDDGERVEIIEEWLPRSQIEVIGKEVWATPWIIEQKELELAKEKFDGQVVELATFEEVS